MSPDFDELKETRAHLRSLKGRIDRRYARARELMREAHDLERDARLAEGRILIIKRERAEAKAREKEGRP